MIRTLHVRILFFLTILVSFAISAIGQVSIDEYYQNATGKTGDELKTALHTIIRNHTELPYTTKEAGDQYNVWEALKITDEDPNNTNNVLLIYTGRSEVKTHQDDGSGDNDSWNREHIWAKSHGDFGTDRGAGTDIHHLRACDRSVNTARSNKFFDNGGNAHSEATECKFDADSWEPRDAVKGDIARMILYMAVCYEEENGDSDLELTSDMSLHDSSLPFHGRKETLLQWHQQDPVDDSEKARNEKVYTIQGNRNPFIDYPEWADEIWTTVVDIESPEITELSPTNNSTGVSLTPNLIIKFNEEVKEGTGNVVIKRYNDETTFETYSIPNARLAFSNNQLLINPEAKFEEGVKYYVTIDNGVVTDASSNSFDGISDKSVWNFTATYTAPAMTEFTPADDSENISLDTDLEITFNKNIQAGNGKIRIKTNGNLVAEMFTSDVSVTYNGTQVIIDFPNDLETGTEYYVTIDNNAFVSENGVAFAGISSDTKWSFTTEIPTGIDDSYANGIPSFYPNPAVTEIRLTNMMKVQSMYISNLTGRNIMEIKSPDTRISISKLPKGMYFVTFISSDGSRITKKLMKR